MVWFSGLLPYAQCAQVFERIGERHAASSSIWRQMQHYGRQLQGYVEQGRQERSIERNVLPDPSQYHQQRKGLSMDGGMVNIREEGWRE